VAGVVQPAGAEGCQRTFLVASGKSRGLAEKVVKKKSRMVEALFACVYGRRSQAIYGRMDLADPWTEARQTELDGGTAPGSHHGTAHQAEPRIVTRWRPVAGIAGSGMGDARAACTRRWICVFRPLPAGRSQP